MEVGLYSLLTGISIALLAMFPKRLDLSEHAILFMLNSIVIVSAYTIVSLNWHLINNAQDPERFIAFLLYRSVILQIGMLLYTNAALSSRSIVRWCAVSALFLFAFCGLEQLSLSLGLLKYSQWNRLYTIGLIVLWMGFSFAIGIGLVKARKNGGQPVW